MYTLNTQSVIRTLGRLLNHKLVLVRRFGFIRILFRCFIIETGCLIRITLYPYTMKKLITLLVGSICVLDSNAAKPRLVQVNQSFYEIDSPGGGRFAVEKTHDLKTWKTRQYAEFSVDRGHISNWIYDHTKSMGAVRVKKTKKTIKDLKKEWSDRKIKKYKFRYRQFGASKTDSFFILEEDVTVENGKIIKVEKINFLNHDNVNPPIEGGISDFRTIGQIYDFFEKEKSDSEESSVLLSKDLSHPVWFVVDRIIGHFFEGQFFRLVNDELFIVIEDFEILEE